MKTAERFVLVLVTAPNLKAARRLASTALRARSAACVNFIPKIESHYWWQGKIERGTEVLLLFKTSRDKLAPLEEIILANHPYDTPEFLVVALAKGNQRYLAWLGQSLRC